MPTGKDDQVVIERSSALGTSDGTKPASTPSTAPAWCHKSRKDVTNYVLASTNVTSTSWGPHNSPAADIYSGVGGYEYPSKSYTSSSHANFTTGCVQCHMPPVADNMGIGDHSFAPQLSACTAMCHQNETSFDVNGGQQRTALALQSLRVSNT